MMYQPGDVVVYGTTGVCRIEGIGTPAYIKEKDQLYYKLTPFFDTETIYALVDTKAFMRPIMSREDAERLIDRIPLIEETVCETHDMKMLNERYRACLSTHENDDLVRLIKSVYLKNQRTLKAGRHIGQTDQQYMKRAEKLLYGELAIALGMEYDLVQPYIKRRMEEVSAKRKQQTEMQ